MEYSTSSWMNFFLSQHRLGYPCQMSMPSTEVKPLKLLKFLQVWEVVILLFLKHLVCSLHSGLQVNLGKGRLTQQIFKFSLRISLLHNISQLVALHIVLSARFFEADGFTHEAIVPLLISFNNNVVTFIKHLNSHMAGLMKTFIFIQEKTQVASICSEGHQMGIRLWR